MQGFKTFGFGLALAILPQAITYLTKFDFSTVLGLSPNAASAVGLVVVALRAVTSTPIFQGK